MINLLKILFVAYYNVFLFDCLLEGFHAGDQFAGVAGIFIAMIAALWLCFVYETDYKKTICDTAISPDKKYELILEAVGEAE